MLDIIPAYYTLIETTFPYKLFRTMSDTESEKRNSIAYVSNKTWLVDIARCTI